MFAWTVSLGGRREGYLASFHTNRWMYDSGDMPSTQTSDLPSSGRPLWSSYSCRRILFTAPSTAEFTLIKSSLSAISESSVPTLRFSGILNLKLVL
jgi:hypothetical protein